MSSRNCNVIPYEAWKSTLDCYVRLCLSRNDIKNQVNFSSVGLFCLENWCLFCYNVVKFGRLYLHKWGTYDNIQRNRDDWI